MGKCTNFRFCAEYIYSKILIMGAPRFLSQNYQFLFTKLKTFQKKDK